MTVEVHPSPKPSTSSATVTDYSQIFNMLKSIQHNQNKQSQEMKSLSSRMTEYENSYCTDEGYDYNNYDEYDEQNQETHDNDNQPDQDNNEGQNSNVDKRKSDENNNSKFAAMSKRFKTREICGDKIDDTLAENVTDLFRNGMNEDQFLELTKDENNPRPENCEGLVQVRTNQLIWDILSPQTQTFDRKMQLIQRTVVKAATLLVKTVNKMALSDQSNESDEQINECNDVLALLGHANRKINVTRRELMKPEMSLEYVHLCAQSVDYTSYLFGDDVSKKAKDIEDCSKIGYKIGYGGYSRRGTSRFFGRGRGGRRGARGGRRGYGRSLHRGAGYRGAYQQPAETPKTL